MQLKKKSKQPGSGYWGTGIDLKDKRDEPDKAKEYYEKEKEKEKDKS